MCSLFSNYSNSKATRSREKNNHEYSRGTSQPCYLRFVLAFSVTCLLMLYFKLAQNFFRVADEFLNKGLQFFGQI